MNFSAENSYDFDGKHFIASYLDCDQEKLINISSLSEKVTQSVILSGANVLSVSKHVFPEGGFTMVLLLSESHASIHTYPEYSACFVDLFTCGNGCKSEAFDEYLRNYLNPKQVESMTLLRGRFIKESSSNSYP